MSGGYRSGRRVRAAPHRLDAQFAGYRQPHGGPIYSGQGPLLANYQPQGFPVDPRSLSPTRRAGPVLGTSTSHRPPSPVIQRHPSPVRVTRMRSSSPGPTRVYVGPANASPGRVRPQSAGWRGNQAPPPASRANGVVSSVVRDNNNIPAPAATSHSNVTAVPQEWDKLDTLEFDLFRIPDQFLAQTAVKIFERSGYPKRFNLSMEVVRRFVDRIANMYRANPYHNFRHAVDVLQTTYAILQWPVVKSTLEQHDLAVYCALIAALAHDTDHPGVNNPFLIDTSDPLAIEYNDRSVLENHHARCCFVVMQESQCDMIGTLNHADKKQARAWIINAILATDMAEHAKYSKEIKEWSESRDSPSTPADDSAAVARVLSFVLKAADISNVTKTPRAADMWSVRVHKEFTALGDRLKSLNMPVAPFLDREKTSMPSLAHGFVKFQCKAFFTLLNEVFPCDHSKDILTRLEENLNRWELEVEKEKSS